MKEWLRVHPEEVPPGHDATHSTSQQLRSALKRRGWTIEHLETEVRLIPPGVAPIFTTGTGGQGDDVDEDDEDGPLPFFAMEYQLRDFLGQNLPAIPMQGRTLRLYVDPTGTDGIEYPTAVGPIDILALDENGDFVVLELKRARTADRAVGQLARYMGWVKHTIGRGRRVSGVIVARSIDDKLRYAASVVPDLSLFEYTVQFKLAAANSLPA